MERSLNLVYFCVLGGLSMILLGVILVVADGRGFGLLNVVFLMRFLIGFR